MARVLTAFGTSLVLHGWVLLVLAGRADRLGSAAGPGAVPVEVEVVQLEPVPVVTAEVHAPALIEERAARPPPRPSPAPPAEPEIVAAPDYAMQAEALLPASSGSGVAVPAAPPGGGTSGGHGGMVGGAPEGATTGTGTADGRALYIRIIQRHLDRRVEDHYPPRALRMGWEGQCEVVFRIGADGNVSDVQLVKSSGFKVLDDAAVRLIRESAPYPPPPPEIGAISLHEPVHFRIK